MPLIDIGGRPVILPPRPSAPPPPYRPPPPPPPRPGQGPGQHPSAPVVPAVAAATAKQAFLAAVRTQESGGNYQAVNPGSGALGAWQIMPSNLPGWLAQAGLPQMTPWSFLHDPGAQNTLAWVILGGYFDRYGAAGAAAMWYSGQPDPTKTYGKPPVWQYVADVLALMGRSQPAPNYGPAPGGPAFNLPPPNEGNWSDVIDAAAAVHVTAAAAIGGYAAAISRMT